jgi:transcriptional regulator with XRE-family HTH domain
MVQSAPPIKALLKKGDLVMLARETGFSYAYLWRIVNGVEPGRLSTRKAIARVLGRDESELFNSAPAA